LSQTVIYPWAKCRTSEWNNMKLLEKKSLKKEIEFLENKKKSITSILVKMQLLGQKCQCLERILQVKMCYISCLKYQGHHKKYKAYSEWTKLENLKSVQSFFNKSHIGSFWNKLEHKILSRRQKLQNYKAGRICGLKNLH